MLYLQYFNQILTVVLEVLDDSDSSIRELALSLIIEMLKNQVCYLYKLWFFAGCCPYCCTFFPLLIGISCLANVLIIFLFALPLPSGFLFFQKDAMEDSVELVIEKLLHVTKAIVPKVTYFCWNISFSVLLLCFPCLILSIFSTGFKWSRALLDYCFVSVWSFQMS